MTNNKIINIEEFIKENNITTIYLDVDGVLFASCQACAEIINEMQDTDFDGSDVLDWDFKSICPTITDKDVEEMFVSDNFFQRVQWVKGALDFVRLHRDNIIIITHSAIDNFIMKRIFFDNYGLEDIPIIPIPLSVSKSVINMCSTTKGKSLFIDDSTMNLLVSNANYTIQFREYEDDKERQWQKHWYGDIMYEW